MFLDVGVAGGGLGLDELVVDVDVAGGGAVVAGQEHERNFSPPAMPSGVRDQPKGTSVSVSSSRSKSGRALTSMSIGYAMMLSVQAELA